MKLLHFNGEGHHKNRNGIRLMTQALNVDYTYSNDRYLLGREWDIVYIPAGFFSPEEMPNTKLIIYGPHNFVFPNGLWTSLDLKDNPRVYYNCLSEWVNTLYSEVSSFEKNMKMAPFPFAVDVERFKPAPEKIYERDCFIYFKHRDPAHLSYAESLCKSQRLSYNVITYGNYNENDYIHMLNTSKFGIWIGTHESQGFAFQEALSMNIPLVVWDAKSMFYEINGGRVEYASMMGRYKLESTSATSWDSSCGLLVDKNGLEEGIRTMSEHYRDYAPRDFVVRELGPAACMQRWIDLLEK